MAAKNENKVRMIGPKGRIATVSRKASQSKDLANLGFRIMDDVIVQEIGPNQPFDPAGDANPNRALGFRGTPRNIPDGDQT